MRDFERHGPPNFGGIRRAGIRLGSLLWKLHRVVRYVHLERHGHGNELERGFELGRHAAGQRGYRAFLGRFVHFAAIAFITAAIGGIWDTGSGALTIGGTSALTLFGTTINGNTGTGIEVDAGAGPLTINAPLVLQNNQQWINNSASALTVNGDISGTGSLTVLGSGTLTLTGSNTFSGSLTVDGGTLQMPSGFSFHGRRLSNDWQFCERQLPANRRDEFHVQFVSWNEHRQQRNV